MLQPHWVYPFLTAPNRAVVDPARPDCEKAEKVRLTSEEPSFDEQY